MLELGFYKFELLTSGCLPPSFARLATGDFILDHDANPAVIATFEDVHPFCPRHYVSILFGQSKVLCPTPRLQIGSRIGCNCGYRNVSHDSLNYRPGTNSMPRLNGGAVQWVE